MFLLGHISHVHKVSRFSLHIHAWLKFPLNNSLFSVYSFGQCNSLTKCFPLVFLDPPRGDWCRVKFVAMVIYCIMVCVVSFQTCCYGNSDLLYYGVCYFLSDNIFLKRWNKTERTRTQINLKANHEDLEDTYLSLSQSPSYLRHVYQYFCFTVST